jgi:hypothetical protein
MLAAIGIAELQKRDSLFSINNAAQDAGVSQSRSQRAMVAVKLRSMDNNYPTLREIGKKIGVAHGYVAQADLVLQYAIK